MPQHHGQRTNALHLDFGQFDFGQFDFGQPKSKLAEVKIGRNRNWPKSKLAKSNRWYLFISSFSLSFSFALSFFSTELCGKESPISLATQQQQLMACVAVIRVTVHFVDTVAISVSIGLTVMNVPGHLSPVTTSNQNVDGSCPELWTTRLAISHRVLGSRFGGTWLTISIRFLKVTLLFCCPPSSNVTSRAQFQCAAIAGFL